jgi:hypothetical protein
MYRWAGLSAEDIARTVAEARAGMRARLSVAG